MGFFKKIFGDAADELKKNFEDAKKEMRNNLEEMKRNTMTGFTAITSNSRDDDEEDEEPKILLGDFRDGVLTIREGITELDNESLEHYKHIRKIVFPASLESLDSDVINEQNQLEELDFSKVDKLKTIPDEFIYGENKIRKFVIPNGVTEVGDGFLGEAKSGAEIFVPASVEKLGYITGASENNMIVYLFAADIEISDVEEDVKTLYVLPDYYDLYAKKLKDCNSEARLRDMPEEMMIFYGFVAPKEASVSRPALESKQEIEEKLNTPANGGLFSARLEAMIAAALQDGFLTDKEREMLKRRVEKEGEDWDEVEMIIEARLQEAEDLASNESVFLKKDDVERPDNTIYMEQPTPESVTESNLESTKTVIDIDFSPSLEERDKDTIIVPEGVTTIPEMECFNNSFQSVIFPSTLVKIGEKSFENCQRLNSVDFSRCKNLLEIEKCAFCECKSLKEIILPDTVRLIGESAFSGLEECEKIVMPASLELIGDCAFSSCVKLTAIDFSRCEKLEDIGDSAFADCESLKEIILPSSLKKIGSSAFNSCQLKEIVIPDSVEYIGSYAFGGNQQLVAATIGVSAKDYFDERSPIFGNTPNLKELTFKSEVAEYTGAKALTKVTFCDTVKTLGKWVVAECEELEEIVIPDSVTKIGYGAFAGCTNLTSIVLSDNITEIADDALASTRVKEIVFPRELCKLGRLGENCEKLRKLEFSKVSKLKVIPENFICPNTPKLKEIALPVGVTKLEECIGAENLSRLFLPPTIEEIEDLHQINLDIYCFAPKLEELGEMIESIEDPDEACHLFVLPEYFDAYKAQCDAEKISDFLTIDVIPEEFRYYYDS